MPWPEDDMGIGYYGGLAIDLLVSAKAAARKAGDEEALRRLERAKDAALLAIYASEPDWLTEIDREYCRRHPAIYVEERLQWKASGQ